MDPLDKIGFLRLLDEDEEAFQDFVASGFSSVEEETIEIRKKIDLQKYSGFNNEVIQNYAERVEKIEPTLDEECVVTKFSRIQFPKLNHPIYLVDDEDSQIFKRYQVTPLCQANIKHKEYSNRLDGANFDQSNLNLSGHDREWKSWDLHQISNDKAWPQMQLNVSSKKSRVKSMRNRSDILEMQFRLSDSRFLTCKPRPTLFLYVDLSRAEADSRVIESELWKTGILTSNTRHVVRAMLQEGHSVVTTSPKTFDSLMRRNNDRNSLSFNRIIISRTANCRVFLRSNVIYTKFTLRETLRYLFEPIDCKRRPLTLFELCAQRVDELPDLAFPVWKTRR